MTESPTYQVFLKPEVMQAGQTTQLSEHPLTRGAIEHLRQGE